MAKDYYETLGVSRSAPVAEIKKAYRRLARKYHPDLNPGDKGAEAKFKEIQEAYSVLTDPKKKTQYDQFGFAGDVPPQGAGPQGRPSGFEGFDFSDYGTSSFKDFFENLFGAGGPRAGGRRGRTRRGPPLFDEPGLRGCHQRRPDPHPPDAACPVPGLRRPGDGFGRRGEGLPRLRRQRAAASPSAAS